MTREEIEQLADERYPTAKDVDASLTTMAEREGWIAGFTEGLTMNSWHSVADGGLPNGDIWGENALMVFGEGIGFEYSVQYIAEDKCFGFSIFNGFDEEDDFEVLNGVEYWMEIPKIPEKGDTE